MNATDLSELLNKLVGEPPSGLEWLSYLFSCLLVFFGLIIVFSIFKSFFSFFNND